VLKTSFAPATAPKTSDFSATILHFPRYVEKSSFMFGFFKKNPTKELEKQHKRLMEEAMAIQRSGDLKAYAVKIDEAEKLMDKIVELSK
jgi:hypothetical protein